MKRTKYFRSLRVLVFFLRLLLVFQVRFQLLGFLLGESKEEIKKSFFSSRGIAARELFFQLGGIYIKLGQFLGNLFHILPEEFLIEMQELQDSVPPHPFSEIDERFKSEFGIRIKDVFEEVEEIPVASASIGQVHKAVLGETKVAIKVLYPGIEKQAKGDLRTISFLIWAFEKFIFPISQKELRIQLKALISLELNLQRELDHLIKLRGFFLKDKDIYIPEPVLSYSGRFTLVTEYIEGDKFRLVSKIRRDKNIYFEKLIKAYVQMIFEFRFFHADPHPGNLILMQNGQLCLIDFGAVGSLSPEEEKRIEQILSYALQGNYYGLADILKSMGAVKPGLNYDDLVQLLSYSVEKWKGFLNRDEGFRNLSFKDLGIRDDLKFLKELQWGFRDIMKELILPPNYLALYRVLGILLGLASLVDPYRSLLDYAEKPFQSIVNKGRGALRSRLKSEGEEILTHLLSLPKEAYHFYSQQNRKVPPRLARTSPEIRQFVYGILASVFFFFAQVYEEKSWKEIALLFYCIAGLGFWSFAKASLESWKE